MKYVMYRVRYTVPMLQYFRYTEEQRESWRLENLILTSPDEGKTKRRDSISASICATVKRDEVSKSL